MIHVWGTANIDHVTDFTIRNTPDTLLSCRNFKRNDGGSSWANKPSFWQTHKWVRVPALPQCQSVAWEHDVVTARMLSCAEAASAALNFVLLFLSFQAELWLQCWMLGRRLAGHLWLLLHIYKNDHLFQLLWDYWTSDHVKDKISFDLSHSGEICKARISGCITFLQEIRIYTYTHTGFSIPLSGDTF